MYNYDDKEVVKIGLVKQGNSLNFDLLFWRAGCHPSVAAAGACVLLDEVDVPLGRGAAGLRGTQTQTARDGALVGLQLLQNMALRIPNKDSPPPAPSQ